MNTTNDRSTGHGKVLGKSDSNTTCIMYDCRLYSSSDEYRTIIIRHICHLCGTWAHQRPIPVLHKRPSSATTGRITTIVSHSNALMEDTRKLFSYHDLVIRACDVECLQPGQWLNDQCIELYLLYLQHHVHAPEDILFVPPSVTCLVLHGGHDVARSVMDSMHLSSKSTIFFAVNNSTNMEVPMGGTHWSAMVVDRHSQTCTHYDSIPGMNARIALRLKDCIVHIMAMPTASYIECSAHQGNSYDCGVFCLAVAARLVAEKMPSLVATDDVSSLVATDGMPVLLVQHSAVSCRFEDLNSRVMLDFRKNLATWVHSRIPPAHNNNL